MLIVEYYDVSMKIHKEIWALQSHTTNPVQMERHEEQLTVFRFLNNLCIEMESVRLQILSGMEVPK